MSDLFNSVTRLCHASHAFCILILVAGELGVVSFAYEMVYKSNTFQRDRSIFAFHLVENGPPAQFFFRGHT
jgi:hypothetical protein